MIRPCKRIVQVLLESLDLKRWTRIGATNKNAAGWLIQRSQSWLPGCGPRPGLPSARKFGKSRGRATRRRQSDTP
jgi:hypothetical protein